MNASVDDPSSHEVSDDYGDARPQKPPALTLGREGDAEDSHNFRQPVPHRSESAASAPRTESAVSEKDMVTTRPSSELSSEKSEEQTRHKTVTVKGTATASVSDMSWAMTGTEETPYLFQPAVTTDQDVDDGSPSCRERVDNFLNNSIYWAVFACILTVWALFIDDVRILCFPKSSDLPLLIIGLVILGIFVLEFVLCWLCQEEYAWSLGAFMDLLAALSLIPFQEILEGIEGVSGNISVARVARAVRALRILRATRAAVMALKTESRLRRLQRNLKGQQRSVLADTLLQSTNIKMLLGVLIILLGTTLLDYPESDRSPEAGIELLDRMYGLQFLPSPSALNKGDQWKNIWHDYRASVEGVDDDSLRRLMKLQVWGVTYLDLPTDDLRKRELIKLDTGHSLQTDNSTYDPRSLAYVSEREMQKRQAINSLIMTVFSVVVILLWAWSFRRDHTRLVIEPVKRMISVLREMAMDPRQAVLKANTPIETKDSNTEMHAIETCIGKFGELLKVGFGEAGMGIIARNLRHLSQENFDPVVPGVIVKAIFGFCDIRNFTDCCEVLNEDTMIFTNSIAAIVHSLVEGSGGTVNKNIGDAFLSVWKLRDDESRAGENMSCSSQDGGTATRRSLGLSSQEGSVTRPSVTSSQEDGGTTTRRSLGLSSQECGATGTATETGSSPSHGECQSPSVARTSQTGLRKRRTSLTHHLTGAVDTNDAALKSFLQMNELMRTNEKIQKLGKDPRLQKKLPGYNVTLGSGLHQGWAIEGAVGTSHKVDATYLSPHVNMAARLEAATKQYGVSILMSDSFVVGLSRGLHEECRPVDRVTVKGSQKPLLLYVHFPSESPELTPEQRAEFLESWCQAFTLYVSGSDWRQAAALMRECLKILPTDEPAKVLLEVIDKAGGEAPADWPGFRALTAK